MRIIELLGDRKKLTKRLYAEVFDEDPAAYVSYYYTEKLRENRIFAFEDNEEGYVSMLHLNPYTMHVRDRERLTNYIVAVATKKEFRGQRMMKRLLIRSLKEMHANREAFTYLMPAAKEIYLPYGFRYIYDARIMVIEPENLKHSLDQIRGKYPLSQHKEIVKLVHVQSGEEKEEVTAFMEAYLSKRYQVYTKRDLEYVNRILKELKAEGGYMAALKESGKIHAIFTCEPGPEYVVVKEIMAENAFLLYASGVLADIVRKYEKPVKIIGGVQPFETNENAAAEQPYIMGRIVHLASFLQDIPSEKPASVILSVADPLLKGNDACFVWQCDERGTKLTKLEKTPAGTSCIAIEDLARLLFSRVTIEELVAGDCEKATVLDEQAAQFLAGLTPLNGVYINENV